MIRDYSQAELEMRFAALEEKYDMLDGLYDTLLTESVQREESIEQLINEARKETAKEIFDDIKYGFENTPYYKLNPMLVYELKTILLHIAKKYGVEIDTNNV